ncbi:acyl-CoA dehydrogenase family protein [Nocardioides zeae]|uniref:Acyl-CoA dehydrogenase family protein n=1 Tax=Nocardioides imazamoxiresistens TaxID=3231893 RepID=A0ABU3PSL3_9ACTN|nr:acyl-CoA dehydrogenase family protein [Nocardioides zeae]MDT9592189.1 acyl-CoA dehydrogenase family protein [Nocardioides zeae]
MTSPFPSLLYSDLEDDLRATVRDLLKDRCDVDAVLRRTDGAEAFGDEARAVWTALVGDLGLAGLAVPEERGGAGASWREVAVVLEELGRSVADVPFFSSAVLATSLLTRLDADEPLASLVAGDAVAAVVAPFGGPLSASGTVRLTDAGLTGTVPLVAGAAEADWLVVPLTDAVVLVRSEDATITAVPSLDMTRRLSDVTFDAAAAEVLARGPEVGDHLRRTADLAAALLASEQLAVAERVLEMTVDYVQQRRQFGRAIGSYQAVKHRLADLWTDVMRARAVARYAAACAAAATSEDDADLPVAAAVAQAVCGEVAQRAAEECVQLHGGIGFTWEHPAHLYLKRAMADAAALGSTAWHRHRVARLVDLPAPSPLDATVSTSEE